MNTENGKPDRTLIIEEIVSRTGIDDKMIEVLVRAFYERVRHDPLIGPVFEAKVTDWEAHMSRLCAFWSSVALMSGRYHGQPMAAHLPLPIDTPHFERWLELFAATAREVCPPPAAAHFLEGASRIADSLELCVADQRGEDEFSSPACLMHEVSDAYMGYADKAEIVAFLDELLEAERAGARVTLESSRAADSGRPCEVLRIIQQDEARWCAMLVLHIRALGGEPSSKVGAFYGKAMAIADLRERIVFLNRGQGWVVRKLREMLPRVRDSVLHADLADMLRSHEINIDLANGLGARA
jgi:hemoglobin